MWNNSSSPTIIRRVSPTELTIWIAVQLGLGIVGALLVILLLVVMSRLRKLKTGSGFLIAHSLAMDFLYCLVTNTILNLPIYLKQIHNISLDYCFIVNFTQLLVMYVGNWTAVVLAFNRLFAIVLPFLYAKVTTKRALVGLLSFVWCVGLSCAIPVLNISPNLIMGQQPVGSCGLLRNEGLIFSITGAIGIYVPIAVLGAIYISLFLISGFRRSFADESDQQKDVLKRRLSIAKALFLSFVWYVICTLPPPIISMFFPDWWRGEPRVLLYTRTAQVVGYGASPLFFFAINLEYRKALGKMLGCTVFPVWRSHKVGVLGGRSNSPHNFKLNSMETQRTGNTA